MESDVRPVPREKRQLGLVDILVLWSSLGVGLLVLQAGALLSSLGLIKATIISLIGSIVGSLILAAAGVIGSRYGVPTMVSFRPILGKYGSYLPTILNVIQLIGWTAFELMIMAKSLAAISAATLGSYAYLIWVVVLTAWCTLLALGGPLVVVREWLEKIAVWLVFGSTAWITIQVLTSIASTGYAGYCTSEGSSLPLLLALDLVIAMPISWMPLVSDYNRFARSEREGFIGTMLGYTLSNTWFYALGAALVLATGMSDIITAILSMVWGGVALMMILVDETDNAFADIYSGAVSLQNMFNLKQWKLIIAVALTGALLAFTVPLERYEWFLLMIGGMFVPLFGVLLADYYVIRRGKYRISEFYEEAPSIRVHALIAWLLGLIVYMLIVSYMPELGATIPSLLISSITYITLSKLQATW